MRMVMSSGNCVYLFIFFWQRQQALRLGRKKISWSKLTLSFLCVMFFLYVGNMGTSSDLSCYSRSALKARGQKIITMAQ